MLIKLNAFPPGIIQFVLIIFIIEIFFCSFSPTLDKLQFLRAQWNNKNINYFADVIKIYKIKFTEAKNILREYSKNE